QVYYCPKFRGFVVPRVGTAPTLGHPPSRSAERGSSQRQDDLAEVFAFEQQAQGIFCGRERELGSDGRGELAAADRGQHRIERLADERVVGAEFAQPESVGAESARVHGGDAEAGWL